MHRPGYHFLPPKNWINDPNGLIHWDGKYHLFYQYNPYSPRWGNMHWGHAFSEDQVHWQHLPIALEPTPGSADSDGCWSGVVIDNNGTPTALYTGWAEGKQRPCLAIGDENLTHWKKYPDNPVIPDPPASLDLIGFRDHCVWTENGVWFQLIGAGQVSKGGLALLYRSTDLYKWEYIQPLLQASDTEKFGVDTGDIWECPSFFPLGGKHVLIFSVWKDNTLYYPVVLIGDYHEFRFHPQDMKRLDGGYCTYYAPQTMLDPEGRRLVWGWIQERRPENAVIEAGWAGVMSLPRQLSLLNNTLHMDFVPELKVLRAKRRQFKNVHIYANHPLYLGVESRQLELIAELRPAHSGKSGFCICRSPDGREETRIYLDWEAHQLVVDLQDSSLDPSVDHGILRSDLNLKQGETVTLHCFLDHSVIETIANQTASITARIYPILPESREIWAFSSDVDMAICCFDIWEVKSIW
jgi:beta-fructofuranosidase